MQAPVTRGAWSADDIGELGGTVAIVTGANSGIGFETARGLAGHGAHVVLACRNQEKARQAASALEGELDRPSLELLALDLSDLVSVQRAAEELLGRHARLHLLVNNAGIMGAPYRQTADGFELQMATNHLGHFALTGLLLERLVTTGSARVVTISSLTHRVGRIPLDDVEGATIRNTWQAYASSKLANLLFTLELSRRLDDAGVSTISLAAHPGWTRSNLAGTGAGIGERRLRATLARTAGHVFGQSAASGALPSLYAATAPGVPSGACIGPRHLFELFGPPTVVRLSRRARDREVASRLWDISEDLTGVRYALPSASAPA